MNLEDRKLLDLAAKAFGAKWSNYGDGSTDHWTAQAKSGSWIAWNPLLNDGDALRLAVHLDIGVTSKKEHQYEKNTSVAVFNEGHSRITEKHKDHSNDAGAATRYVIVRAAAEIGKAMQEKH